MSCANFFFERIEDAISNRKAKVEQDFIDGFKKNPHMAWRWLQQKFPGEYSQRAADQQMAESATPKAPLPKVIINVYDPDKESESQGESGRSSN